MVQEDTEPSNALVPFLPPSLPVTLSVALPKVRAKKVKNERKDPTNWDDSLTRLFLYNRLALRDSNFKGKSVPKEGLTKVLERMKKEDPEIVKERNVTVSALLNKWNKMLKIMKNYHDHQSQTGACSLDPPQYYDLMLDCLGTEGREGSSGRSCICS